METENIPLKKPNEKLKRKIITINKKLKSKKSIYAKKIMVNPVTLNKNKKIVT